MGQTDTTIDELDLDSPGDVPWWSESTTTLVVLLVRMVSETAQHAGHADIVRELIDGRAGNTEDRLGDDPDFWDRFTAQIRAAAEAFKTPCGRRRESRCQRLLVGKG